MERTNISFDSHGARCAGWFFRPAGNGPYPCVVMAHGFGAIKEARLDAYAERFAGIGLAALVFDYRHLGESEGEPRQLVDITKQQQDWQAALAYARTRPDIDKNRIALWGTSFSGGHVITTAARDKEIRAVVAQVPFTDGFASAGANPIGLAIKLLIACLRDALRGIFNQPPYLIEVIGPPGAVAAMSSPGSAEGYQSMLPANSKWINAVAARVMVPTLFHRPIRLANQIECPILICVCNNDDVTPPAPARKVSQLAKLGELKEYAGNHFSLYTGKLFEESVNDECDFFRKHLLAR